MSPYVLLDLRSQINQSYLADESTVIQSLLEHLSAYDPKDIEACAMALVLAIREKKNRQPASDAFLREYRLSSQEGVVLMGMAEALLRIPDEPTQDMFLQEKLTAADWREHLEHSDSFLVNVSTRALYLTGRFEDSFSHPEGEWSHVLEKLMQRMGAPLIRSAIKESMRFLADKFVIAENIDDALLRRLGHPSYRYSFDMLGEAALTESDAARYYAAYLEAIDAAARHAGSENIYDNPGISIKLSALHPRYEPMQHRRAVGELSEMLLALAKRARDGGVSITVDAEEADRLDMSLDIFSAVYQDPSLKGWEGLGLAVQAYQKRAIPVIRWLGILAETRKRRIPLRLVKGAYWDSEIKRAQEGGLSDYPVFTHKTATDVSYLACAALILSNSRAFYPQFATHNAHTIAAIHQLGKGHAGYEFQRLHGMGEQLYSELIERSHWPVSCRIYAPVGRHNDLLPYLVRRLLENGANTSFINLADDPGIELEEVIKDPVVTLKNAFPIRPRIILPKDMFGDDRINSKGLNLGDIRLLKDLQYSLDALSEKQWHAQPLVDGECVPGEKQIILNPSDRRLTVGEVDLASGDAIGRALESAAAAFRGWRLSSVEKRAESLRTAADLLESNCLELVSLCVREGGRTIRDALAEIREAVDFCRFYAHSALENFCRPIGLPGPVGEENRLHQFGRGVFVCISPWNFPVAIFTGQVAAALAAGNCVIAKPAGRTPLTAMRCIQLLHEAGIPENVLHFLPAGGAAVGRRLLADSRVAGVAFTGSTETAQTINRTLARFHRDIVPLIAETGGQNVMIADSSALTEQVVRDAVQSAFNSAGQRCSALRVLFLQREIADKTIAMLIGAMRELTLGDPGLYSTDIGPLIGREEAESISRHVDVMQTQSRLLYRAETESELRHGSFYPPCLIELDGLSRLEGEVFGPVLHVIRYDSSGLNEVIDAVNALGYGLTLGIHSRINSTVRKIQKHVRVGNIYVNRNMIGAVVGVQPFGGMGLSGSGPKAGGPHYLQRFAVEQTVASNSSAIGGNAALMARDLW
ncbi:MAG: bifunctional proline dehydrogenase/L-glutamate gamma-semialdehyde dehydrogenase PutA [Gammaproteobacteria bacterium]